VVEEAVTTAVAVVAADTVVVAAVDAVTTVAVNFSINLQPTGYSPSRGCPVFLCREIPATRQGVWGRSMIPP
jgi:hypothetical protein